MFTHFFPCPKNNVKTEDKKKVKSVNNIFFFSWKQNKGKQMLSYVWLFALSYVKIVTLQNTIIKATVSFGTHGF